MQNTNETATVTIKIVDQPNGHFSAGLPGFMTVFEHTWQVCAALEEFQKAHPPIEVKIVRVKSA